MRIKVLFFGVLREALGGKGEEIELPEGSTVGDLLRRFAEGDLSRPGLQRPEMLRSLAVAVNLEYAGAADVLREGDEVALLPPVSGGLESRLVNGGLG